MTQSDALSHRERFQLAHLGVFDSKRELVDDVRQGLLSGPKSLPPKYFYDEHGSYLFDRICDTPEYYPTRTEHALLDKFAGQIIDQVQPAHLIELGSGTSRKTEHLLDALEGAGQTCRYIPVDVCAEVLVDAGERLTRRYHWLQVEAMAGEYSDALAELPDREGTRLFVFLGGSIGNFSKNGATELLQTVRKEMDGDDRLLMGMDRVKDEEVLNAAYNDSQGYTARFNLNVLQVLNRELEADFDLGGFEHIAFFNQDSSQIEMHLRAVEDQQVYLGILEESVEFEKGETILTEISKKYTEDNAQSLLNGAGFEIESAYQPDNNFFSLTLAKPD